MTSLALSFLVASADATRAGKGILTGLRVETKYWVHTSAGRANSASKQFARTSDTSLVYPATQAVAQSRQDSFPLRGRPGTSGNGLVRVLVCQQSH